MMLVKTNHMSGHNKWSQIKHQKGAVDKKRGIAFGKIAKAISVAAREEANPEFNPRLRTLIEKAKQAAVPKDVIMRALDTSSGKDLEDLVIEAYGPGGIAILAEAITDSRNRTINELKHLIGANGGKFAEQGSVRWAFEGNEPKFMQEMSADEAEAARALIEKLEEHDDVQSVMTNAAFPA